MYSKQLDRYYIDYCSMSVEDRLAKHLSNHKGYTSKAKDWEICYTELYSTRSEAYQRERELQKWIPCKIGHVLAHRKNASQPPKPYPRPIYGIPLAKIVTKGMLTERGS